MDYNKLLIVLLIGNALWYIMIFVLKQNDYESSWFIPNLSDFSQMYKLIKEEQNTTKKNRYIVLLIATGLCMVLFLSYLISFVVKY
ncbi:MAG: hypothetical protein HKP14_11450 [Bacteroidia bacterium]|nr:hypothetical protein [Bacteroidia bacterium]